MDRPESWQEAEEDQGDVVEGNGEDTAASDDVVETTEKEDKALLRLRRYVHSEAQNYAATIVNLPGPLSRADLDQTLHEVHNWIDQQSAGLWNNMDQVTITRVEQQAAGSDDRLRVELRKLVRHGSRILVMQRINMDMHIDTLMERSRTAFRFLQETSTTLYNALYDNMFRGPNPLGIELWTLNDVEFLVRLVIEYRARVRWARKKVRVKPKDQPLWGVKVKIVNEKPVERILPAYPWFLRNPPRLFPPSTVVDQLEWVWRGVPRKRMLEALLNILLVEAWIGSREAISETTFYEDVFVLVQLIGNKDHKRALKVVVTLGKVARRHETHLRGGKRRLLKRTHGHRL